MRAHYEKKWQVLYGYSLKISKMLPNFWQLTFRTDPAIGFDYEAALRTANALNPPACETKSPQLHLAGLMASLGGRRSP